jgi:hypothetical protein
MISSNVWGLFFIKKQLTMHPVRQSVINRSTDSLTTQRGLTMKFRNILWIALVLIIPGNVWAYGDGGSSSASGLCKILSFSDFTPVNNAEVAPQSAFSFFASGAAYPNSIKVTIKGQSIPVTVTPKKDGFQVTGMLPDSLKGAYAKINVDARGSNQCEGSAGWLVKVTE